MRFTAQRQTRSWKDPAQPRAAVPAPEAEIKMNIAQLLLPGASLYERKCQRIDAESLTKEGHEVLLLDPDEFRCSGADLAHVYGPRELPLRPFIHFPLPYVASGRMTRPRFAFRRPVLPRAVVSPVNGDEHTTWIPEPVDDALFALRRPVRRTGSMPVVGVFDGGRPGVASMIERTRHRLESTRDDVRIQVFSGAPPTVDFSTCDVWIDPSSENDFDGLTAEAVVAGLVVIAARTPLNQQRLEQGRTGFLVPANDPNEMSHAILTALFKPELAEQKLQSAHQTISKWKPRQRLRALLSLYESLKK